MSAAVLAVIIAFTGTIISGARSLIARLIVVRGMKGLHMALIVVLTDGIVSIIGQVIYCIIDFNLTWYYVMIGCGAGLIIGLGMVLDFLATAFGHLALAGAI